MLRTAAVAASFLLVSSVASAGDIVVLKDGTVLDGKIGEMVPNQSITITVEGQARKIDWKDIDRVNIDREKVAPPPPQQAPRAMTLVHVDGPPGATIQALDPAGTMAWKDVCEGACDRDLPTDGLYRIDAPGIRRSRSFKIEGARSNLTVDAATSTGFVGGLSLLIVGGAAFIVGINLLLLGVDVGIVNSQTSNDFVTAGLVVGGVGIASMIVGGILFGGNLRTKVTGATTVRVPAWRDFPQAPSSRAMALSFPAISGSF
jgi:hypothetical protein